MDKKVTVGFYKITRHHEGDLGFSECLRQIATDFHGEYKELDEDVFVRLERYDSGGQYVKGEFTRKQTVNLPPKVVIEELEASTDPIAHRAAFQYHVPNGIVAIEHNRNGMTLARINQYIIDTLDHAGFEFSPVITEGAWKTLRDGNPRKLIFKIANPENLNVGNDNRSARSITQSLVQLKNIFGGPVVEAQIGFGRGDREGILNKRNVISVIGSLLSTNNRRNVEKIQVKLDDNPDLLDFLAEHLKDKENLELDDTNIDAHYRIRKTYIESLFRRHHQMLNEAYGRVA